jgi:hypothetical protein
MADALGINDIANFGSPAGGLADQLGLSDIDNLVASAP